MLKKLYQKLMYIPRHEKVPEKVFMTRTALSIFAMLVCMVVLCSATYAWFTAEISSPGNTIETATYSLTITDSTDSTVSGEYVCQGASNHIYTFTLTASGTAEKGYCKVIINGDTENPYFTHQINQSSLTVSIKAADKTIVTFEPCWGTSAVSAAGGATYGDDEVIVCANAEGL